MEGYVEFNPLNPEPFRDFVSDDQRHQQKVLAGIFIFTIVLIGVGTYVDWRQKEKLRRERYLSKWNT